MAKKEQVFSVDMPFKRAVKLSLTPNHKALHRPRQLSLDKVYNSDCLKFMAKMPDGFVDMVITSPPYDEMRDYHGNSEVDVVAIATDLYRVVKDGGVVVWVIGDQTKNGSESGTSFRHALTFMDVGFNLFDTMIYQKPPAGAVGNNKTYWQSFEYMFVFSKGTPKTINLIEDRENEDERDGDRGTKRLPDGSLLKLKRGGYSKFGRRTNIWQYRIGNGHSASDKLAKEHPAVFPEKLAADHIVSWTNPKELVFDPFMGSGTTAKMAVLNDRRFIGCDIVAEYCKIAAGRIELALDARNRKLPGA